MQELFQRLRRARPIDLGQKWFAGMPHWPTHPPFAKAMTKLHGDTVLEGGASSAAEAIALGTHVGTHMDGLCHFSCGGLLHGGAEAEAVQSEAGGLAVLSIDRVAPIVRRGVLLDVAGLFRAGALEESFEITEEHLEVAERVAGVRVEAGDVVLLRTGWARYWREPRRFINGLKLPGPALAGARWLSSRGAFAAGSDTVAFERQPSPRMEVHVHLLVESGIHIFENLNLERLAEEGAREFLFLAAPLAIEGATGAPVRPFALVEEPDERRGNEGV
jgi:kynurenine formamidase